MLESLQVGLVELWGSTSKKGVYILMSLKHVSVKYCWALEVMVLCCRLCRVDVCPVSMMAVPCWLYMCVADKRMFFHLSFRGDKLRSNIMSFTLEVWRYQFTPIGPPFCGYYRESLWCDPVWVPDLAGIFKLGSH